MLKLAKKIKNRLLLSLLFTIVLWSFSAYSATPLDEIQAVQVLNATGKLGGTNSKWLGNVQAQARMGRNNNLTEINRVLLTAIVGYQVTPRVSVWQGYTYTPGWNAQTNDRRDEHRLFQQVSVENQWKQVTLTSRTRLEERFIENTGGITGYRLRQQFRGQVPISADKKWSAVVFNEYFVNLNAVPNHNKAGYNQNILFVGVNRQLNKRFNVEGGYALQTLNRVNTVDQFNHIIQVQLNYRW
jgi:hypothetical protein